jgi:hypothetical protein
MLPIVAALINAGLPILGQAVLNKGKEVIEEKLGVKIPEIAQLQDPNVVQMMRQLEIQHEEFLLSQALEHRKLDIAEFKEEVADRQSARGREIELEKESDRPWWWPSFLDSLTLVVVIGGAYLLVVESFTTDLRMVIVAQISSVLAYYYGTTRNSRNKDDTIQTLAKDSRK